MAFEHFDGRLFDVDQFDAHCATNLHMTTWRPSFIVLHNTGNPAIAGRPSGYSAQEITNLADYYVGLGWHGGPHLIIDQNGIHILNALEYPGVHSPSWNHVAWGVEMLGDYDVDSFASGVGATIAANAVRALAALEASVGMDSSTMRLHKEDPLTTHICPGRNVIKADVIDRVHDRILQIHAGGH